jgi:hypothetical protein
MRIIPTKKFLKGTPFSNERGQGMLEYMLVLMVILGTVFVAARPVIARIQKKFEKGLQGGIFKEDASGGQFYYFPIDHR